ncbi:MAG: hypothetical protein OEY28_00020 [Nitrospira sp.]|nr:hypothetical protein [Nitrospira sp.]
MAKAFHVEIEANHVVGVVADTYGRRCTRITLYGATPYELAILEGLRRGIPNRTWRESSEKVLRSICDGEEMPLREMMLSVAGMAVDGVFLRETNRGFELTKLGVHAATAFNELCECRAIVSPAAPGKAGA